MADVPSIPRISCDNCGLTVDKVKYAYDKEFKKPREWGSCRIEGTRGIDSYGGKDRIDMTDLCPDCANIAITAAARVLKEKRGD